MLEVRSGKNESVAAVVSDGNGGLRATMQVSHLSTWMLAFGLIDCTEYDID
jgi:hypothetical protein